MGGGFSTQFDIAMFAQAGVGLLVICFTITRMNLSSKTEAAGAISVRRAGVCT